MSGRGDGASDGGFGAKGRFRTSGRGGGKASAVGLGISEAGTTSGSDGGRAAAGQTAGRVLGSTMSSGSMGDAATAAGSSTPSSPAPAQVRPTLRAMGSPFPAPGILPEKYRPEDGQSLMVVTIIRE